MFYFLIDAVRKHILKYFNVGSNISNSCGWFCTAGNYYVLLFSVYTSISLVWRL